MPFRSHRHESFSAFQAFIKQWLTKNLSAVQLDGSEIPKKNPITTDEVTLDKPLNTVVIEFHGDTTRDALKRIADGEFRDFILLGPSGDNANWRFHHAQHPHKLADFPKADGMYAFVKQ